MNSHRYQVVFEAVEGCNLFIPPSLFLLLLLLLIVAHTLLLSSDYASVSEKKFYVWWAYSSPEIWRFIFNGPRDRGRVTREVRSSSSRAFQPGNTKSIRLESLNLECCTQFEGIMSNCTCHLCLSSEVYGAMIFRIAVRVGCSATIASKNVAVKA